MNKLIDLYRIGRYNIKTLPIIIPVCSLIYGVSIILLIHIFKVLNFSPVSISEYLLVLIGIIMFTHLAIFEEENNIYEFTYITTKPHYVIVAERIISYMILMYLVIMFIMGIEKVIGMEFNYYGCVNGSFITAFYLGIIGMVMAYITKQKAAGYMSTFSYYVLDMFTGGRFTKEFYLFSLTKNDFTIKINLLITSVLILIAFFIYLYRKL